MGVSELTDISQLRLSHQLDGPGKTSSVTDGSVKNSSVKESQGGSFAKALQGEYEKSGVQFSRHARERMQTRGVRMTQGLYDNLNQAVNKAREKGSRDVVVISDQNAFIVNVPNNTVITTMSGLELKENIFTNIDSAVLI